MTNIHLAQINFDSGFRGDYKGYHIDGRLIQPIKLTSPIFLKMLKYKDFCDFINIMILAVVMFDSIVCLNQLITNSYQDHYKIMTTGGDIENLFYLNNQKEQIIHIMKRIADDLIMTLCAYYDSVNIKKNSEICITSIGELKSKKKYSDNKKIDKKLINDIKKELNYNKYKIILNVINDLHNAYKHSCLINESRSELCPAGVSLSAYYAKYNKLDNIYYLNHNLMQVVIGFSDFLLEFFGVENSTREHSLLTQEKNITI